MSNAVQHAAMFLFSWLIWFPLMYVFVVLFAKKKRIGMTTKQKVMAAGKGALFVASVSSAIQLLR